LIDDGRPLVDTQVDTMDSIRTWARSLAGVTGQLVTNDPQVRTLLHKGPGFANETARLLNQVKPTLPVLLANLTAVGQIGVTYNPSLEQVLVLLPPYIAALQSYGLGSNNPTGYPIGDFTLSLGDPPACTVGFLPPSQWRSPADTTTIDTPDGLYCKLPQDSPIAVRGARNYPCMGHPGKRAPTVEICDSDRPFEPTAMRQHALGPYPFDPNLMAQGVPQDDRITLGDNIFGPTEGTPMPPGPPAAPPPPAGTEPAQPPPVLQNSVPVDPAGRVVAPPDGAGTPPALGAPDAAAATIAPSGYGPGSSGTPSIAFAQYNPRTGKYIAPDGEQFQQADLVRTSNASGEKTWKDLFPT
jgi:hypothetical protein